MTPLCFFKAQIFLCSTLGSLIFVFSSRKPNYSYSIPCGKAQLLPFFLDIYFNYSHLENMIISVLFHPSNHNSLCTLKDKIFINVAPSLKPWLGTSTLYITPKIRYPHLPQFTRNSFSFFNSCCTWLMDAEKSSFFSYLQHPVLY